MWLQTMKSMNEEHNANEIYPPIQKCYMLFPTLENMRFTPNGKFLCSYIVPFQKYWETLVVFPLCSLLPTFLKRWLLQFHLSGYPRVSKCSVDASLDLFEYDLFTRFADLGRSEMGQVLDLDEDAVSNFHDKMFIYFGATDKWCPLEYVEGMKAKFPNLQHKICDKGIDHAFVVSSSEDMGEIFCDLVQL